MNGIIVGAVAAIALLIGSYQTGVRAERKRGEAASLRAKVAALQLDLSIARKSESDANDRAAKLETAASADRGKLDAIEKEIAKRALANRCALSHSDAERLRLIR